MMSRIRICVYIALVMAACNGVAPQRPSQRMGLGKEPQPDSAQLALMELNRRMANEADQELMQIAQAQPETYALYESRTWIHIYDRGDETLPAVKPGEQRAVRMIVRSLDGQLLSDTEQTCTITSPTLPPAVVTNIQELHPGGHARLYTPWYAAYGIQGNAYVQPYQNVLIDLYIP